MERKTKFNEILCNFNFQILFKQVENDLKRDQN